jgi:hypothetical protein
LFCPIVVLVLYIGCFLLNVFPNAYAMLVSLPAVPMIPAGTYIVFGKLREMRRKREEEQEEKADEERAKEGTKNSGIYYM